MRHKVPHFNLTTTGYLCEQEEIASHFPHHERTTASVHCLNRTHTGKSTADSTLQSTTARVDNLIYATVDISVFAAAFPQIGKQDCDHSGLSKEAPLPPPG